MTKTVIWLLGVFAASYVAVVGLLFVKQRSFLYPGTHRAVDRRTLPGFEEAVLRTRDGLVLRAIHAPARSGLPTIIFFHGNGDDLVGAAAATQALGQAGYGLLLPEYRGYGGNSGAPSEGGIYADGEAALSWLSGQGVPLDRTVLIGNSLGSGVATELAVRHRVAGLVLVSGFASIADVAAEKFQFAPVRLLLRDRFDNASKMPRVNVPVLVLHGTMDTLIPPDHGIALARLARRVDHVEIPGAGHELAYLPASHTAILRWLRSELPLVIER